MSDIKSFILNMLVGIKTNGPSYSLSGICWNVECHCISKFGEGGFTEALKGIRKIMHDVFHRFPKFSGDEVFPIPGGANEYYKAVGNNTLWDKSSEYGQLRWELLDFMIETLQIELAQV